MIRHHISVRLAYTQLESVSGRLDYPSEVKIEQMFRIIYPNRQKQSLFTTLKFSHQKPIMNAINDPQTSESAFATIFDDCKKSKLQLDRYMDQFILSTEDRDSPVNVCSRARGGGTWARVKERGREGVGAGTRRRERNREMGRKGC